MKEVLLENIRKILGSKIVQVKGLMPLGEMWYGITFSAVQKFVMLEDNFIGIDM